MTEKRRAVHFGGLALAVLFGGCLVALVAPRYQVAIAVASFVGYVACTRKAMILCRADDLVFEPKASRTEEEMAREAVRNGLIAGSAGALSLARSMTASERAARFGSPRRERAPHLRPLERTR